MAYERQMEGKAVTDQNAARKCVAFTGTPWISELMIETVSFAGVDSFDFLNLSVLHSDGIRIGLIRKACKLLEFAWRVRRCDVLILVYVDITAVRKARIARLLRKKTVLYWLGTDYYNVNKRIDKAAILQESAVSAANIAYGPTAISELRELGVDAVDLVTPPKIDTRLAKMPNKHAVLLSVPDGREDFYGYPTLKRLISDYPTVEFHVVRSSKPELWTGDNVVFWGVVENEKMNEIYDKVSIVVRYPEHDGTSMILMESSIKAKRLISRNAFPFAWIAANYEELCQCLDKALAEPLKPHLDIREKALAMFDRRTAGLKLANVLHDVISSNPDKNDTFPQES